MKEYIPNEAQNAETRAQDKRGVVLSAYGENFQKLAIICANHLKESNPDLPITLFTDALVENEAFDQQIVIEDVWVRSKLDCIIESPYQETGYLDVDTLVVADINDCFDVLSKFDMALCHDQYRNLAIHRLREKIPNSFPQFNGGVLFFRKSAETLEFLRKWRDTIREEGLTRDQTTLRELAYHTDLRICVLPPEYNMHEKPANWSKELRTAPRILHIITLAKSKAFLETKYPILYSLGPRRYLDFIAALRNDPYLLDDNRVPEFSKMGEGWPPQDTIARHKGMWIFGSSLPTNFIWQLCTQVIYVLQFYLSLSRDVFTPSEGRCPLAGRAIDLARRPNAPLVVR